MTAVCTIFVLFVIEDVEGKVLVSEPLLTVCSDRVGLVCSTGFVDDVVARDVSHEGLVTIDSLVVPSLYLLDTKIDESEDLRVFVGLLCT